MKRSIREFLLAAVVLTLLLECIRPEAGAQSTAKISGAVRIDSGMVSGVTESGGVTAYLGIPFAAPPTGEARFRPPQPPANWDGVRKADQFGKSCPQQDLRSFLPFTEEFMTQGNTGEDCLSLNVWTAGRSGRRPVMFWIYGGGFGSGSTAIAIYEGAALAKKGVVLVSVNYRVGALGFLVHPDLSEESKHQASGNYGLLDQIAALQWVQRNIAMFGGDPKNVTIFGQSAGAIAVYDLMESPLAKGLFVRAISESGPGLIPGSAIGAGMTLAQREQAGVKYAESLGAHSAADLRKIPAADFYKTPPGGGRGGYSPGGPVVDGWVLTGTKPVADSETTLMIGMTADDIGIEAPKDLTLASYQEGARMKYGAKADEFLKLYPATTDDEARKGWKISSRDLARVSIDLWSAEQLKLSPRIYTYFFDRPIPWPAHPEFGAFHTSDVPYVFGTLHTLDRPWQPVDEHISDVMSSYWVNFATSGNPNSKNLPVWPAYVAGDHKTMELGAKMGPMAEADDARLKFQLDYVMSKRGGD